MSGVNIAVAVCGLLGALFFYFLGHTRGFKQGHAIGVNEGGAAVYRHVIKELHGGAPTKKTRPDSHAPCPHCMSPPAAECYSFCPTRKPAGEGETDEPQTA